MFKSTVAKYNALLVVMILVVAAASLAFNYHLMLEDRLAHARQMLTGAVSHHVADHLREDLGDGRALTPARLVEIIHESLRMPGVGTFGIVVDSAQRIVGGTGLTDAVRQRVTVRPENLDSHTLIEQGDLVFLPIPVTDEYRIIVGFSKDSVAAGIGPLTANTLLFVAAALAIYFLLAFTALRYWIINPLIRFLETRLRGSVDGIVSGTAPPALPEGRFNVLPEEISVNIERNMMALHTWARHKASFDKFIAVTTAENNKQQLAANLYNILGLELPLKNLSILEINYSLNRLALIYDAAGAECPDDLLADPQRCFVYRSGSRLVQMPGERVCGHCHVGAGEVLICKPLVAAGKEMGVCKVTLDHERMSRELGGVGNGNPVAVAESLLDTYIYLTSLSLSNLTLLDSYKNQAITDGLTGLYNRRYMVEYMASLLSISKRGNVALALFMVDIDNFKRLNDEYGHHVGDQVLKEVAKTMRRAIRDCDIIARYGGEEFVVTLPGADSAQASEVGERLRDAVASIEWDNHGLGNIPQVTVSVGIAEFPLHGYSHYHLTNAADKALYVAKRSGKNRVVVHQSLPEGEPPGGEAARTTEAVAA
jgi:diguanylate cyclase (GGDEF)-like protein